MGLMALGALAGAGAAVTDIAKRSQENLAKSELAKQMADMDVEKQARIDENKIAATNAERVRSTGEINERAGSYAKARAEAYDASGMINQDDIGKYKERMAEEGSISDEDRTKAARELGYITPSEGSKLDTREAALLAGQRNLEARLEQMRYATDVKAKSDQDRTNAVIAKALMHLDNGGSEKEPAVIAAAKIVQKDVKDRTGVDISLVDANDLLNRNRGGYESVTTERAPDGTVIGTKSTAKTRTGVSDVGATPAPKSGTISKAYPEGTTLWKGSDRYVVKGGVPVKQ